LVKIVWDLNKPLPKRRVNEKVTMKPINKNQLIEVGKILVVTWGGFIKDPETTVRYVGPHMEAGLEQPFIAYLGEISVGCVSPKLDKETKSGVLDGGVHVLPEYRRQRIATTLLLTALKWLKENGMESAWVTPGNPESVEATQRAEAFYLATGGKKASQRNEAKAS
jgi:GNAT superfamily N-acetyltransferase